MSKRELAQYNEWFHRVLPDRMSMLSGVVASDAGIILDRSVESLEPLGRWFEKQVEVRSPTQEELAAVRPEFRQGAGPALSIRTLSLAMDLGMYLGEVILKNVPGTRWHQLLQNKKLAEYGQPVLVGRGRIPLNPVHVIVMTAYGVARSKPADLQSLYETWSKLLGTNTSD